MLLAVACLMILQLRTATTTALPFPTSQAPTKSAYNFFFRELNEKREAGCGGVPPREVAQKWKRMSAAEKTSLLRRWQADCIRQPESQDSHCIPSNQEYPLPLELVASIADTIDNECDSFLKRIDNEQVAQPEQISEAPPKQ